jgi:hypothetical protein
MQRGKDHALTAKLADVSSASLELVDTWQDMVIRAFADHFGLWRWPSLSPSGASDSVPCSGEDRGAPDVSAGAAT